MSTCIQIEWFIKDTFTEGIYIYKILAIHLFTLYCYSIRWKFSNIYNTNVSHVDLLQPNAMKSAKKLFIFSYHPYCWLTILASFPPTFPPSSSLKHSILVR